MGEIDNLIAQVNNRYLDKETGKPAPLWENKLVYDTNASTLEPLYYWLLDFITGTVGPPEKVVDTFTASPGSAYFGELGMKAQKMQEEGMKILGNVNIVIKSIINLVYDLRNFDMRLKQYEKAKSKDPVEKEAGILGLKEVWMSSVDMQRGNGSINYMAQGYGFTTLRPAFMAAKSEASVDDMDLNDIVKRVLKPRVSEFFSWIKISEAEMRKRYDIERSYLKSQIDSLKLYSSWVKPYLQAAEQLRMKESGDAALVSVFDQMILELQLYAKKELDKKEAILAKDLPIEFIKKLDDMRPFYKILTVDFKFRTYHTPQGAPHAGRVEIDFKAYVLNEDEILVMDKLRTDKDKDSMLNISKNLSENSLEQLKEDIDYFLAPKKEEKKGDETIFGDIYKDFKKTFYGQTRLEKEEELKEKTAEDEKEKEEHLEKLMDEGISEDSHDEQVVREFTELESAKGCFNAFDIFKKSHGLASFLSPFDDVDAYKRVRQTISEVRSKMNIEEKERKAKDLQLGLYREQ